MQILALFYTHIVLFFLYVIIKVYFIEVAYMEEDVFWGKLEEIKREIQKNISNLEKVYELMEKIDQLFLSNEHIVKEYKNQRRIEKEIDDIYIVECEPVLDKKIGINYSRNMSGIEKVNHLVQKLRLLISNPDINNRGINYNLTKDNLRGECRRTTNLAIEEARKKGIEIRGYNTKDNLGIVQKDNHAFSIVTIEGKKYIIDCTYRQFFAVKNNINTSRIKDAGRYMLEDEQRRKVAEHILKYGWIEATPENIKCYLDGFVMADKVSSDIETLSAEQYLEILDKDYISHMEKNTTGRKDTYESTETEYIIDSEPFVDDKIDLEEYNEEMTDEQKLTIIVQTERRRLSKLTDKNGQAYNIMNDNLRGDCTVSAGKIVKECYSRGISSTQIFTRNAIRSLNGEKMSKHLGHNFTLAKIGEKHYIIDCTYRQFFSKTNNFPENEDHITDPGMYMIEDAKRRKIAEQILKNGWIEATPNNLKGYLDGFLMAERKSFEDTGITCEEYEEMFLTEREISLEEIIEEIIKTGLTLSEVIDALNHNRDSAIKENCTR